MRPRLAAYTLMLGNLVVGIAVLLPAGMMQPLADDLAVSIREAGLLIAYGGVVLCVGSPLVAQITTTVDRRILLSATLALVALGHAASAFAPDYASLMAIRLAMLIVAAVFTPIAASTIAQMVGERERAGRIAFVFLGWSLALAVGLPLVTFVTDQFGWRTTYGLHAGACALVFVLLAVALPSGLRGQPMAFASWGTILRNPRVVLMLTVTLCWTAGLYVIFPYVGPLLARLAGGGAEATAAFFALIGIMGFAGNMIATRVVGGLGPYRTLLVATATMAAGAVVWTAGTGALLFMGLGAALWGLGFAATNSMVQARLVATLPAVAAASVALNTSWLYVGQALGSWLGGELIARDMPFAMNALMTAFLVAALVATLATRERAQATP